MGDVLSVVPPPPAGRARADFVCNSAKCRDAEGAAPVYELPVTAVRCPVCGSKRLRRLYNAVNISKSGFFKLNRTVDAAVADALSIQHDNRDARLGALKRAAPSMAVPIREVAGPLGLNPAEAARPTPIPTHPLMLHLQGRRPMPGPDSKEDREHQLPEGVRR